MGTTTMRTSGPDAAARRYAATGDRGAREALVALCEPLVRGVARGYDTPGLNDDLVQVGFVGLLNAIEQFDPSRGTPFVLFARPYISGEISHFLRDHQRTVRRPRWLDAWARHVDRATDDYVGEHGRYPSPRALAAMLGIEERAFVGMLRTHQTVRTVPLDLADVDGQTIAGLPPGPTWDAIVEDRTVLLAALRALTALERAVVFYVFFTDFTQVETARRVGVSQKHVSRLLASALLRLREFLVRV